MRKILSYAWFSSGGSKGANFGIVITENNEKEKRAYIGNVNEFDSEETSAINIAQWGAKFPLNAGLSVIAEKGIVKTIIVPDE